MRQLHLLNLLPSSSQLQDGMHGSDDPTPLHSFASHPTFMPRNERLKAARTSVQRYAYSQAAATILLANPIPVHSDEKVAWKGTSHENLG